MVDVYLGPGLPNASDVPLEGSPPSLLGAWLGSAEVPVRRSAGSLALAALLASGIFYVGEPIAAAPAETITLDKWFMASPDPVRKIRARPELLVHFALDPLPRVATVDGWEPEAPSWNQPKPARRPHLLPGFSLEPLPRVAGADAWEGRFPSWNAPQPRRRPHLLPGFNLDPLPRVSGPEAWWGSVGLPAPPARVRQFLEASAFPWGAIITPVVVPWDWLSMPQPQPVPRSMAILRQAALATSGGLFQGDPGDFVTPPVTVTLHYGVTAGAGISMHQGVVHVKAKGVGGQEDGLSGVENIPQDAP